MGKYSYKFRLFNRNFKDRETIICFPQPSIHLEIHSPKRVYCLILVLVPQIDTNLFPWICVEGIPYNNTMQIRKLCMHKNAKTRWQHQKNGYDPNLFYHASISQMTHVPSTMQSHNLHSIIPQVGRNQRD